ncbi:MAG: PqqD family protein [Myxococcota bacterium]|jgi:hypothetical protein|nr:PqqD family protein [Myxococcota bacterium]
MTKPVSPDPTQLDWIPSRKVEHELSEEGRVVVLRPKWTRGLLARYLQPLLTRPYFKVRLDAHGSATWNAIDGVRTVAQLGDLLRDEFGEEVEPCHERVSKFIHSLFKGDMVEMRPPSHGSRG